jgi:trk system potassium uptake protein TrkA
VHAVVVGCGRVGSAVASRLASEGWTVAVIDQSMESFNRLDPAFPGDRVEGHALDEDVLCHAGIKHADACVVCTDGDNTNLVTAQIV